MRTSSSGEYYLLISNKKRETELIGSLEAKGFSGWARGGIEYGPINEGWEPTDDLVYSMIKQAKETRLVAFSKKRSVLYIVYWEK